MYGGLVYVFGHLCDHILKFSYKLQFKLNLSESLGWF